MMFVFVILGIVLLIVIIVRVGTRNNRSSGQRKTARRTIRCPNCGSRATVKGDHWECGWCGDYGPLR